MVPSATDAEGDWSAEEVTMVTAPPQVDIDMDTAPIHLSIEDMAYIDEHLQDEESAEPAPEVQPVAPEPRAGLFNRLMSGLRGGRR